MKKVKKAGKDVKEAVPMSITGCSFYGVRWDESAISVVSDLVEALIKNSEQGIENAKALQKIAEVLKASNVTIESLLKVEN